MTDRIKLLSACKSMFVSHQDIVMPVTDVEPITQDMILSPGDVTVLEGTCKIEPLSHRKHGHHGKPEAQRRKAIARHRKKNKNKKTHRK